LNFEEIQLWLYNKSKHGLQYQDEEAYQSGVAMLISRQHLFVKYKIASTYSKTTIFIKEISINKFTPFTSPAVIGSS